MAWVGSRTRARPVVPEGFSLTPLLCPNFIIDVQAAAKRQTETRYGRTLARRTCDPGASRRSSAPKGRGLGASRWALGSGRGNTVGQIMMVGRWSMVVKSKLFTFCRDACYFAKALRPLHLIGCLVKSGTGTQASHDGLVEKLHEVQRGRVINGPQSCEHRTRAAREHRARDGDHSCGFVVTTATVAATQHHHGSYFSTVSPISNQNT